MPIPIELIANSVILVNWPFPFPIPKCFILIGDWEGVLDDALPEENERFEFVPKNKSRKLLVMCRSKCDCRRSRERFNQSSIPICLDVTEYCLRQTALASLVWNRMWNGESQKSPQMLRKLTSEPVLLAVDLHITVASLFV